MNLKKWVKSIQTAGYNGARTVVKGFIFRARLICFWSLLKKKFTSPWFLFPWISLHKSSFCNSCKGPFNNMVKMRGWGDGVKNAPPQMAKFCPRKSSYWMTPNVIKFSNLTYLSYCRVWHGSLVCTSREQFKSRKSFINFYLFCCHFDLKTDFISTWKSLEINVVSKKEQKFRFH